MNAISYFQDNSAEVYQHSASLLGFLRCAGVHQVGFVSEFDQGHGDG